MQCYHLVYIDHAGGRDVVLATKNIRGFKSHGHVQSKPIIWNNCGQVVISGGGQEPGEPKIQAAQREFYEETGIDFRVPAVRTAMRCTGEPWEVTFGIGDDSFSCTYQAVATDSPLIAEATTHLQDGSVDDDELHDIFTVGVAAAGFQFHTPQLPLAGWRQEQYNSLSRRFQTQADRRMMKPFDWFVMAVTRLLEVELESVLYRVQH